MKAKSESININGENIKAYQQSAANGANGGIEERKKAAHQ
jgi:hypothetical protein